MNRTRFIALTTVAAATLALGFAAPSSAEMKGMQAHAEKTVQVGGAPMYPTKNIVQNAVNSKDHTTLVAAVKAAGLVDTLQGPGPFTVFAPTNKAFGKLPKGTVETLLKPENKQKLTDVLTVAASGNSLTVWDSKGGRSTITIRNVFQSNGVIHVVDSVLLPG